MSVAIVVVYVMCKYVLYVSAYPVLTRDGGGGWRNCQHRCAESPRAEIVCVMPQASINIIRII